MKAAINAGIAVVFCVCVIVLVTHLPKQVFGPLGFETRTNAGPVVLQEVQRLSRLETCRYNGHVVLSGETSGWAPVWVVGDRMLMIARGEVVAGVDLAEMGPDDVRVEGQRVLMRRPEARVLHTRLDNQTSEVFERRTGILSQPDRDLESRLRREAEAKIQQSALQSGVLETAQENAEASLRRHLGLLGFRDVQFF
jgi:hypothetical protein